MAIFGPKPWVNPFRKMSIFRLFELLVLIAQKGVFSFQNIAKVIFLAYIALKKNVCKLPIFGQKPWVTPFRKTSCFDSLERRFLALEYRQRPFPGLYCLKKKIGNLAIFGPKSWVNPFGKMSVFRLFELLVFIAQKGVFWLQNIVKDNFLAYIG